jgi:hypothetical protein
MIRPSPICPDEGNDPADYAALTPGQRACLAAYIGHMFMPSRRGIPRVKSTSYGLKQPFDAHAFYVTNGQFKAAMRAAGYDPLDATARNWSFAVSYRDPAMRRRQRAARALFD